ncbi:MAG: DUF6077 domain-containing protein [Acidimicrobiales bacterium]|nr:DUF6077 domain-containing protein [Acidimicrobiales bacterium]
MADEAGLVEGSPVPPGRGARIARGSDVVLDAVVGALAAWTVVFHLARLTGMPRDGALVLWLIALAVAALMVRDGRLGFPSVPPAGTSGGIGPVAVVASLVVAAGLAWLDIDGLWWPLAWLVVVAVLGLALRAVWRGGASRHLTDRTAMGATTGFGASAVLVLAVLAAVLSLVMVRPDQDDVFVVNRSAYVEAHSGAFPERDTIFSDEVLPVERPAVLPTSIEPLVGTLAARLPVGSAALSYLGLAPLIAALGVLATWRLLRALGMRAPVLATWAGTLFLVLDGAMHGSFGNFFVGRSWQGKAVFLMLVVPTLWHHGQALGRNGSKRHLVIGGAGILAGLGLTSSAAFIGPSVLVAATAATALDAGQPRRIGRALVASVPTLLAGLYALIAEPQRLDEVASGAGRMLAAVDIGRLLDSGTEPVAMVRFVFGQGPAAVVAIAAVLTAWAVVRDRGARLVLLAGPIVVMGFYMAPGMFDVLDKVGSADAVVWRSMWILPVPAMVGLVLAAPRAGIRAAQMVVPVVVLVGLLVVGTPIVSDQNRGAELVWPPSLDLPRPEQDSARVLIGLVKPGMFEDEVADAGMTGARLAGSGSLLVAGPEDVNFAVSVLNAEVRSVNPRSSYLQGRHVGPVFLADERQALTRALDTGVLDFGDAIVRRALDGLAPDAVCQRTLPPDYALEDSSATSRGTSIGSGAALDPDGDQVAFLLFDHGYLPAGMDATCLFWLRG